MQNLQVSSDKSWSRIVLRNDRINLARRVARVEHDRNGKHSLMKQLMHTKVDAMRLLLAQHRNGAHLSCDHPKGMDRIGTSL